MSIKEADFFADFIIFMFPDRRGCQSLVFEIKNNILTLV